MKLKDVAREDAEAWRNGLKKGRANRSVNRQVRAVRAALNYAVEHAGHIGNVKAWKLTQAKNKLPGAPLISNDEGGHWTDQQWCGGIARAIVAGNKKAKKPAERIPEGVSAYSFRHTRISELLQVYGIDPLTTAQQTGTSIAMIERYYFKFISSSMRDKLNAVKSA